MAEEQKTMIMATAVSPSFAEKFDAVAKSHFRTRAAEMQLAMAEYVRKHNCNKLSEKGCNNECTTNS